MFFNICWGIGDNLAPDSGIFDKKQPNASNDEKIEVNPPL